MTRSAFGVEHGDVAKSDTETTKPKSALPDKTWERGGQSAPKGKGWMSQPHAKKLRPKKKLR